MSELDSTTGLVALAAAALALVALITALVLALRLRRLRAAQRLVLGEAGAQDLVAHAQRLQRSVSEMADRLEALSSSFERRASDAERRLAQSVSHAAVVRYDAYDEMSGRQSSSIALLDDHRDGLVLSSILHREQARFYAKPVSGGESELGLSPEERSAIEGAMARAGPPDRHARDG